MRKKFKINLHNHTTYSDGMLIPAALCGIAFLEYGFEWIGISDHFEADKVASSLDMSKFRSYREEILKLRKKFPEKKIFIGLEVDWNSKSLNREDLLSLITGNQIEYLLIEGLTCEEDFLDFLAFRTLIPDFPVGIAHWDIRRDFSLGDFYKLVPMLLENKVFIEITGGSKSVISVEKGEEYYYEKNLLYYKFFLQQGGIFSLGSDIHYRLDDLIFFDRLGAFLEKNGLLEGVEKFIIYMENRII